MKLTWLVLVCLTGLSVGCGPRLSHQQDYTIQVGEILSVPIDSISQEQTIRVLASSPGVPINVHVFLKEHEEAIERKITLDKPPENLLAHADNAEQISLQAVVPAEKEAVVRVQAAGPQSANVHLEITN